MPLGVVFTFTLLLLLFIRLFLIRRIFFRCISLSLCLLLFSHLVCTVGRTRIPQLGVGPVQVLIFTALLSSDQVHILQSADVVGRKKAV